MPGAHTLTHAPPSGIAAAACHTVTPLAASLTGASCLLALELAASPLPHRRIHLFHARLASLRSADPFGKTPVSLRPRRRRTPLRIFLANAVYRRCTYVCTTCANIYLSFAFLRDVREL